MKTLFLSFAGILASTIALAQPTVDTVTFMAPDTVVAWVVPPGNDSITVLLQGATGGQYTSVSTGAVLGHGGRGSFWKARIKVSAGDTLFLFIGGTGYTGLATGQSAFNGGGHNSANSFGTAGGGGGASDIRRGGKSLANRIFIAGGGGGASYEEVFNTDYYGGGSSSKIGISGNPLPNGGRGAGSVIGGPGGTSSGLNSGTAGTLGQGGNSGVGSCGGGGGGGYYGGGGGSFGGGGGGSCWGDGTQAGPGVSPIGIPSFPNSIFSFISIAYIKNGVGIASVPTLFTNAAIVPNPSLSTATLSLALAHQASIQIQVYDPAGKIVWSQAKKLAGGLSTVALPAPELPAGLYLVRLKAEGQEGEQTLKWIKE